MVMKVRDAIKMIEEDGWELVRTRGSHRQYRHPTKIGRVTIAGHGRDNLTIENLEQHFETGRAKGKGQMMGLEYAVVIEKAPGNYCAYVPDLPGCVATGKTREETYRQISEAIALHLEGLKEDGLPIPEPQSSTALVKV